MNKIELRVNKMTVYVNKMKPHVNKSVPRLNKIEGAFNIIHPGPDPRMAPPSPANLGKIDKVRKMGVLGGTPRDAVYVGTEYEKKSGF